MQPADFNMPFTLPQAGSHAADLALHGEACSYQGPSGTGTEESVGGGLQTPAVDELPTNDDACHSSTQGSHSCEKSAGSQQATEGQALLSSEEECCGGPQGTYGNEQGGRSEHATAEASGGTDQSSRSVKRSRRRALSNAQSAFTSIFRKNRNSHEDSEEPPSPRPVRWEFPRLSDEWVRLLHGCNLVLCPFKLFSRNQGRWIRTFAYPHFASTVGAQAFQWNGN